MNKINSMVVTVQCPVCDNDNEIEFEEGLDTYVCEWCKTELEVFNEEGDWKAEILK